MPIHDSVEHRTTAQKTIANTIEFEAPHSDVLTLITLIKEIMF